MSEFRFPRTGLKSCCTGRVFLNTSRRAGWLIGLALLLGCARPPWPPGDEVGRRVLQRLNERAELTRSATYRVRWESKGVRPHAVFFLDIAFKAPGRFRVSAEGPFGVPAFTAVVAADSFWFVDHRAGTMTADHLDNLRDYQIPMADFFSGHWRALFSGGWGGEGALRSHGLRLEPGGGRGEYETGWQKTRWTIKWNHHRRMPQWVRADTRGDGPKHLAVQTWFAHPSGDYPFWEIRRLRVTGFPGGGEHLWKILKQSYNPALPDRLFKPLTAPRRAQRRRRG